MLWQDHNIPHAQSSHLCGSELEEEEKEEEEEMAVMCHSGET